MIADQLLLIHTTCIENEISYMFHKGVFNCDGNKFLAPVDFVKYLESEGHIEPFWEGCK